ncbi:hypothetical protein EJ08DRAFT_730147 [Tothia fuscella]|uniref:Uncharacterized protein n=1 Tax=Tothia fuscella TaxID=1048955 RepID=A0A9P4P0I8_9PEZI|nr:hypothetical protein EJ08DRAFT_730147 [Tothia fuscella]
MKFTIIFGFAVAAFGTMVAATPVPGGARGGTPAACHESKALYYEKKGDSANAAKERQAASDARKGHYKSGGHKRSPKDEGPVTDMCHEAKAVHLENTGDKAGAQAERAKINKSQYQKEFERADGVAVRNHQAEGWKDTSKKGHN